MGNINYYSTIYYWKTYDYDAPSNASRDDDDDDDDYDDDDDDDEVRWFDKWHWDFEQQSLLGADWQEVEAAVFWPETQLAALSPGGRNHHHPIDLAQAGSSSSSTDLSSLHSSH